MEKTKEKQHFIYLSKNPVKFAPVSKVNNAFFDDSNKQVFTVRSGGVTGVQVQGPTEELCQSFRMADKGPVVSIKLSPKQNVLAVQRSNFQLEFMNLKGKELDEVEYVHGSKNTSANIHGFIWTNSDELLLVTDQGIELIQVIPEKRSLKVLKSISNNINWFVSCPVSSIVFLALGPASTNMLPISYAQSGSLTKLPKFQVDPPGTPTKGKLLEKYVTVAILYGNTSLLVLHHPTQVSSHGSSSSQIVIYTVHRVLQTTRKTHILHLQCSGFFAISTVDNLILVHHQGSSSTLLFDIGGDSDGSDIMNVMPLVHPTSIRPCTISLPGQEPFQCQLYSANWVVFQPNIIIDAVLGFLWYVEIDLNVLINMDIPTERLVDFLLKRTSDKALLLLLCVLEKITDPCNKTKTDLKVISQVFDLINAPYRKQLNRLAQPHIATPAGQLSSHQTLPQDFGPEKLVIDQGIMYSYVFSKFPEKKCLDTYDGEFGIKVILEYLRSLNDYHIPVQELNDLLITCLLQEKHGLSRLHYLLQYRVLADSKPLACTLLSLENIYPPALQLSLDMLKRLGNADDEIMEILLHKQLILPTIRFARNVGLSDQLSARKFLEAAQATNNDTLFYSVYNFFEQRNQRLRGTTSFSESALCHSFVEHMKNLFPADKKIECKTTKN
ncbi:hypothetical protein RUM43_004763 [Polyplax serrata]|uniref:Mic1 domain-containing protein n=1 Tax=Polyplax serrata TaxID=468196 RepID=A0AAN8SB74_POLSC